MDKYGKVWDGIGYPFPNFNGPVVKVLELLCNFISHFTSHVGPKKYSMQLCHIVGVH